MKLFPLFALFFIISGVFAQTTNEKEISTEVNEVTIFIEGAQITSKKAIDLQQGSTLLKFSGLSPFIDAKSIQVKADNDIKILSVNHQQNFLSKPEKSKELSELEKKVELINEKIKLENTYIDIINEDLTFLQANKNIGGKNQEINITNLKEVANYYSARTTSLKTNEIEHNKNIQDLNNQKNEIQKQINYISDKKEFATGEILVKIESKKAVSANFEISYLVKNAGWFPSYDIRVKDISQPVELVYKANIRQDTKIDWKNVKLKLSSSNPNVSGVAPELMTYYLNYNSYPPVYNKKNITTVSGRVTDNEMLALPGVIVSIEGTTIGTITDANGYYSITIPQDNSKLSFSYVGYKPQTIPISSALMNVILEQDETALNEVVVIGYGIQEEESLSQAIQGKVAGVAINRNNNKEIKIRGISTINATPTENQTAVEFDIKMPYSIDSDNKNYTIDMSEISLPAIYTYYCVPKIDRNAFLQAKIIDWKKYSLLDGEANIFFENTYIGKTLLDLRSSSDTLSISLGQDKNVSVSREKIKEFTTKQFIGTKKEETRAWQTTIKNNKNNKIDIVILDQLPISTLEEIEVITQNISGAKKDSETGEIKWEFSLSPNESKELEFRYSVKYPKNKNLVIE